MIKALILQGMLLGFLTLKMAGFLGWSALLFLIFETFIFKALALPLMIRQVVQSNGIRRDMEPYLPNFGNVSMALLLIGGALFLANVTGKYEPLLSFPMLGAAISSVLIGLFVMVSRKKLIMHTLGYLIMENGVYLFSLSIMARQPFLVNLGVLLDLFVGVFLMGIFMNQINSTFEDMNVDNLSELRDE